MTDQWPRFQDVLTEVDTAWMLANTERLWQAEYGACYRHWHQAAALAAELMVEAGLEQIEKISVPADGKTVFLDRVMPLAWDVTCASLTIESPGDLLDDPVVASYLKHPFHIVKGSSGTPAGGIRTRLIRERQLFAGENGRGALVLLEPDTYPRSDIIRALLDLGAIGFVADQVTARYATPDGLTWYNAATEGSHWHVIAQDRPFLGFAISPRNGDLLRSALMRGTVMVHAESDARRYEGEFHHVTGIIPGREARELWLLAHLYEPMPDDNSAGAVGALEVVRTLKRLIGSGRIGPPRFTLRVVCSMEMYGFAAYAAQRGVPLRPKVIGAMNMDAISSFPRAQLRLAPPDAPFCGDYLLEQLTDEYRQDGEPPHIDVLEQGSYSDDSFLGDPTTALPTPWLIGRYEWWHNSQQSMSLLRSEPVARYLAFYATWFARMLADAPTQRREAEAAALDIAERHIDEEVARILEAGKDPDLAISGRSAASSGQTAASSGQAAASSQAAAQGACWLNWRLERELARLADFEALWGEPVSSTGLQALEAHHHAALTRLNHEPPIPVALEPIRDQWAAGIVPGRAVPWPPYDQATVPLHLQQPMPDAAIYGPFGHLLARINGARNVKELIEYAEWITQRHFTPREVRRYISGIERLAAQGQLTIQRATGITRGDIVGALQAIGLAAGDLALVHTSLSSFGHIEGGAATVIDAFLEVLGATGTLLVPAFTNSVVYCDGEWTVGRAYRPFDIKSPQTWVGQLSSAFMQRPDAIRSGHPTHSVAGIGPRAGLLHDHRETDAPTGASSPFGKLVEYGGKMVWFGADLASTTFFHYLETVVEVPYLQPALCRVQQADGSLKSLLIPQWLPGHREFYRSDGLKSKTYRQLVTDGLLIQSTQLGLGAISAIDARQMDELGRAALSRDPGLMLCDDAACTFCRRFQRK